MQILHIDCKRMKSTLFVLPAFVLHFMIVTLPALTLFYYAFTKWNGLGKPVFNGLENFRIMLFEDSDFHAAFINNIVWTLIFLTVPLIMGLFAALLVIKLKKSQMLFRTIYFLPYVVASAIAGRIFMVYFNPYVGIPRMFKNLDMEKLSEISFLGDSNIALFSVAFVDNWHWWGFVMVLLLSALHQIDNSLYEASDIEGANRIQKFWHITIPQIRPTIIALYMFTIIASFLTYEYVWVMTQGGPAGATEIVSTWIYKKSFVAYEAGYASALSLSICLLCIGIYFAFKALQKRGLEV